MPDERFSDGLDEASLREESEAGRGMRARGEEALADLADAMLDNPVLNQALSTALGAGERAVQAQRSAIGALNLASSADLERLERRLRSLSDRLEAIEDQLDDLADEVAVGRRRAAAGDRAAQDPRGGPGARSA
jgi:chromosome segregation ATPase